MDRLLKDTQSSIQIVIRDRNGNKIDADSPPTVVVKDGAGATAANGTSTNASLGTYDFTIPPAATALLDVYEATWTATISAVANIFRTRYEVIGGFIVGVGEVRDYDPVLADTVRYPTAKLVAAREAAEERLEELCGIAFRPRGRRILVDGDNTSTLLVPDLKPRAIVSASIDEDGTGLVALTAGELAELELYDHGAVHRPDGKLWPRGNKTVKMHYEHGLDEAPEPIRRACLMLVRATAVPSGAPDRALSLSTDEGTFRLATAGRDGPTGMPEVDAIVRQFGYHIPAVG